MYLLGFMLRRNAVKKSVKFSFRLLRYEWLYWKNFLNFAMQRHKSLQSQHCFELNKQRPTDSVAFGPLLVYGLQKVASPIHFIVEFHTNNTHAAMRSSVVDQEPKQLNPVGHKMVILYFSAFPWFVLVLQKIVMNFLTMVIALSLYS
jgi:hypothetical protein